MRLKARVRLITGATKHFVGHLEGGMPSKDAELPPPEAVEIRADDGAFYLLYLDSQGKCITDTWHATLDEAKAQANLEFGIDFDEWKGFDSVEP